MALAGFYISLFLTWQSKQSYHPIQEPAWQVVARSWIIYSSFSAAGETETERTGRIAAANLMEQLVFVHISPFLWREASVL